MTMNTVQVFVRGGLYKAWGAKKKGNGTNGKERKDVVSVNYINVDV